MEKKMNSFRDQSTILVTCPKGMSSLLLEEITALGYGGCTDKPAGVELQGSLEDCMRLNLHLRCAHRVLYTVRQLHAPHPDDLYAAAVEIPWEDVIPLDGYVRVDSSVRNDHVRDTRFPNLRLKDAIVDRINREEGRRPDSGPDSRGASVFLHWRGASATIYIDTSGEPLNRRGYRKIPHRAPMQETLAAAVVLSTGWAKGGSGHFLNPMCGSGTLAIEAALAALGRAPGLFRERFGFMGLIGWEESAGLWREMRDSARKAASPSDPACLPGRILASDIDPAAVEAARKNAAAAGVESCIEFEVCDFRKAEVPSAPGIIVLNPEYGERLGQVRELEAIYKALGDHLKQNCSGYSAYVFTGNMALAKHVGLRTDSRTPFYNANIECRLLKYSLYSGSRKHGS